MSLGDVVVTLTLDDSNFSGNLRVSRESLRNFRNEVITTDSSLTRGESGFRSWRATIRDTVIILGLANNALHTLNQLFFSIPGSVIKATAEMERMHTLLRGMSTSTSSFAEATAEANKEQKDLFALAGRSPFSVSALTDSYVKLKAAGIDPLAQAHRSLIDTVSKYGGTEEQLKRASLAVQQMAGKGVISMEELRQQLGESVPDIVPMMARATSMGIDEMIKAISLGRVKAKPALAMLFQQMKLESSGAAAAFAETWDGTMNRLKTTWTETALAIGKEEFVPQLKSQMNDLITAMKSPELKDFGRSIGSSLASVVSGFASAIKFIVEYRDEIKLVLIAFASFKAANMAMSIWGAAGFTAARVSASNYANTLRTSYATGVQRAIERTRELNRLAGITKFKDPVTGRFISSLAAAERQTTQFARAQSGLNAVVRTVGTGMMALGGSMLSMLGPMLVITGAIYGLSKAYDVLWGNKKKYLELQKKEESQLNKGDVEMLEKAAQEKDKEIAALKAKRASGGYTMQSGMGGPGVKYNYTKAELEMFKRQEEAALIEKEDFLAKKTVALVNADNTSAETIYSNQINAMNIGMEETSKAYKLARVKLDEDLANEYGEGWQSAEKAEEIRAKLNEADQKLIEDRKASIKQMFESAKAELQSNIAEMERLNVPTLKGATVAQNQLAIAKLDAEYRSQVENLNVVGRDPSSLLTKKANEGVESISTYQQYVNKMSVDIAKLKARTTDANEELAKLNESIDNGQIANKDGSKITDKGQLKILTDLAAKKWSLAEANKVLADTESNLGDAQKIVSNIARDNMKALNKENPYLKAEAGAEGYRVSIQALIDKQEEYLAKAAAAGIEGAGAFDKATEALAKLKTMFASADELGINLSFSEIKETEKDYSDSFLSNAEKRTRAWKEQSAALDEYVAKHTNLIDGTSDLNVEQLQTIENIRKMGTMKDTLGEFGDMMVEWTHTADGFNNIWKSAFTSFADGIADLVVDGKANFADLARSMMRDLVAMTVKAMIAQAVMASIGMLTGGGSSSAGINNISSYQLDTSKNTFANGGIMTEFGSLPLEKYANGGVAYKPQVALFGEGKTPEAYVPLPDGRTIPVTMSGDGGSTPMNVQVNVINQSSQSVSAEKGQPRFDGEKMVMDIVLKNATQPGTFRDIIRAKG